jgi:amino acid transporter
MISALALFNALLLGYSRIPFVLADDGLLPKALARLDVNGTPRTAVIVSAVFYSLFALVAFGKLIVADVLLYSVALFLEFGALIQLRKTEPTLRGSFRIPLGNRGVTVLASLPIIVLLCVVCVSFADGEYGLPAIIGTAIAIAAGPLMYRVAQRRITG